MKIIIGWIIIISIISYLGAMMISVYGWKDVIVGFLIVSGIGGLLALGFSLIIGKV